jgi:hypothetical protein
MDAGWRCCRDHYRAGWTVAWIKVKWNNIVTIMIHLEDKEVSPMETKNAAYRSADILSSKYQLRMGLSIGSTGVNAGT